MKELVVISGKGGTGKTSIAASFAVLAEQPVIADCDVDAADLHLVLGPRIIARHDFYSGHEAVIRADDCIGCGECQEHCRFDAVIRSEILPEAVPSRRTAQYNCVNCDYCTRSCMTRTDDLIREMNGGEGVSRRGTYTIDPVACEGCGVCVRFCPEQAIEFRERLCGEWMISETRCGPMVHARLGAAAENSGKLVSTVRSEARRIAEDEDRRLIIVDGPPGIGCPVIASLTGATQVLIVTEPTVSGSHDLERVLALTKHFDIPAAICVNKWDLNPEMTNIIEDSARQTGASVAGRVRYDRGVTDAQIRELAVVETDSACAEDIRNVWGQLQIQENRE